MAAEKTAAKKDERSRKYKAAGNEVSNSQLTQVFRNLNDSATGTEYG
jgi:hypothetical protein